MSPDQVTAEARLAAQYLKALADSGVERHDAVELTKFFISSLRISNAAQQRPADPDEPWKG